MTELYKTLIVHLENDTRSDDVKPLIDAISQMRGVLSVTGDVAAGEDWLARIRVRNELATKLWEVLKI